MNGDASKNAPHNHCHEAEVPLDILQEGAKIGDSSFEASLRGFLVILALSLHAVFEGVALGIAHDQSSVWYLFFAIASHKFVISFCVGMQFVSSGRYITKLNVLQKNGSMGRRRGQHYNTITFLF